MSYWVEYSHQKGIRENLMTNSIVKARKAALSVCHLRFKVDFKASAILYSSKVSKPIGKLYFAGGYIGRWMWMPIDKKGVNHYPYYALSNGRIVKMKDY